ncbi:putative DNA replication complex GINS protein PSF2 [Cucumispora dikerogammari]|nr:putative DNA replication complex GINS protein PSF2 [Cucumispora dikerogammari]
MLTPKEYHFISQSIEIECQTLTNIPLLELIDRDYGPYQKNTIFKAPIYLAVELFKKGNVKIFIPYYLQLDFIKEIYEKEKEQREVFQIIHPNFFELHACLIKYQMNEAEETRNIMNELRELRLQKIKLGLKSLDGKALILDNLTQYEFAHVKLFIKESMERLRSVEKIQKQ